MTDPNTIWQHGEEVGGSYMAGQDAATKRAQEIQKFNEESQLQQQRARGLGLANDAAAFTNQRTVSNAAGADAAAGLLTNRPIGALPDDPRTPGLASPDATDPTATPSDARGPTDPSDPTNPANPVAPAGAPGTGLAGPGAASAPAGAMPAGAGAGAGPAAPATGLAPAKGAPMSDNMAKSLALRKSAQNEMSKGNTTLALQLNASADAAVVDEIADRGRRWAQTGNNWEEGIKQLNRMDPSLTIATDPKTKRQTLVVTDPSGFATPHALDANDRENIGAGMFLFKTGHMDAGLAMFAKVDARLAAQVAYHNTQNTAVAAANDKNITEQGQNDAAMLHAQAAMVHAQAIADRNNIDRTKQAFGKPVDYVDENGNAGVMQPMMVNGKMSFEKVDLPAGARFPKQAADVKFTKTTNGGIATDAATGDVLWKVGEDNVPVPAEKDAFEGKDGEKKLADWQDKGIVRGVVTDKAGKLHYGWTSLSDPASTPYSSPNEALAKKPAAAPASKLPVTGSSASRGGGLVMPPPDADPRAPIDKVRDMFPKNGQPGSVFPLGQ